MNKPNDLLHLSVVCLLLTGPLFMMKAKFGLYVPAVVSAKKRTECVEKTLGCVHLQER